jgi:hypothetical protein
MAKYVGKENCLGKDASRAFCYSRLSRKDFLYGHHIIIASQAVGDYHWLRKYGAIGMVVACDKDKKARAEVAKLGSQCVLSPHPLIEDTVSWYLSQVGVAPLASINIDLCNTSIEAAGVFGNVLTTLGQYDRRGKVRVFLTFARGFKDGFRDDVGRINYLNAMLASTNTVIDAGLVFNYQSYTSKSVGAPMSTIVV